ncbi:MAG: hypothetical protein COA57_08840 [Flavobacteriales bacterium]|nr:MAG: hypothetical protein COA57_08840 [Flavobacteriales bacterium]
MEIITDSEFADFLSKRPLFSKTKAVSDFEKRDYNYSHPLDFNDKPFKFKCPNEKETQTFRTVVMVQHSLYSRTINDVINADELPKYFDEKSKSLNLTIHLSGSCQSCDASIDFLVNAYSDKSWDERDNGLNIFIQKIGQFPPYEISPDKTVEKYLVKEDYDHYKKALVNLSVSYGIGAYAYFRRIIENEIKRIIEDISTMDFDGAEKIKEALESFELDHQMANLIDVVNKYLPKSLTELGDNPIRLLYKQLSGGIHSFSDEECLQKAEMIDIILTYVIKKINEEKYQIANVKEAMKKLRNGC